MRFIVGVAAGAVLGAIGAIVYAGQTNTDLRETFRQWQANMATVDPNEIGGRVQTHIASAQATIQQRADQVRQATSSAGDQATESVDAAMETAKESANGVIDEVQAAAEG